MIFQFHSRSSYDCSCKKQNKKTLQLKINKNSLNETMIINIAVSNDYGPSVRFKTVTFQQPALCFLFYHCPTFPTHVSKEIVSWMSGQAKLFWEQNIHLTTFIRHGLKIIWLRFVEDQTKCVWGLLLKLHQFCSSTIQSSVIQSTPLLLTLKHAIHYSEHI